MGLNKKILLAFSVLFFLSATLIYAFTSSDYLPKAQKYIDTNCSKPNLSEKTALECYLFAKVNESSGQLGSTALKIYDANDVELGLFADYITFYYPPLERFVQVNDQGTFENSDEIKFTDSNCSGEPYRDIADEDMTVFGKNVMNAGGTRYFIVDGTTQDTSIDIVSKLSSGICTDWIETASLKLLQEVSIPLPNPVTLPLKYKQ